MFQIGELSKHADVPEKTIRYYEDIGLLPPARRSANSYRVYDEADFQRLRFIRSARALDFTLQEIAPILAARDRREPPCGHVVELLHDHIREIETPIHALDHTHPDPTPL